jgi:hypothetical protein
MTSHTLINGITLHRVEFLFSVTLNSHSREGQCVLFSSLVKMCYVYVQLEMCLLAISELRVKLLVNLQCHYALRFQFTVVLWHKLLTFGPWSRTKLQVS